MTSLSSTPAGAATDPVVVIGYAATVPECPDAEQLFRAIYGGIDTVSIFPSSRRVDVAHVMDYFQSTLLNEAEPFYTGSFFKEVDKFDNRVFNVTDQDAAYMEPEQRMFLELVYQCLESAGYAEKIRGSNTGVYVGHTFNKYSLLLTSSNSSASHGNHSPFIGGRVSYVFDLHGPGMMLCTGCSSSLLAVHAASQALLAGECETALAGGISLDLLPVSCKDDIWNELGITGPAVRCRAFDDEAVGIAKGEGAGVVLLKRLSAALRDGDTIHGVLRSTVANHDGASQGITAPNPRAQTAMLLEAWRKAGISPTQLSYIEAHGTGTKLGDPIEVQAIADAFARAVPDAAGKAAVKCPIGSIKANIGHLADGAAGVVGLIKVLLMLRHETLVRSIHCDTPNTRIRWDSVPVRVCTANEEWKRGTVPRIAGVSAFGLLGTNVHCVVEEPPLPAAPPAAPPAAAAATAAGSSAETVFMLAAMTSGSLERNLGALAAYVTRSKPDDLRAIAYTLNTGRQHRRFPYRCCVVARTWQQLAEQLRECAKVAATLGAPGSASPDPRFACLPVIFSTTEQTVPTGSHTEAARVFLSGNRVNWDVFYGGYRPARVLDLPTYSFERRRFWPDTTLPPQRVGQIILKYNHSRTAGLCPVGAGPAPAATNVAAAVSLPVRTSADPGDAPALSTGPLPTARPAQPSQPQQQPQPQQVATADSVLRWIQEISGMLVNLETDGQCTLYALGFDSMSVLNLQQQLPSRFGVRPAFTDQTSLRAFVDAVLEASAQAGVSTTIGPAGPQAAAVTPAPTPLESLPAAAATAAAAAADGPPRAVLPAADTPLPVSPSIRASTESLPATAAQRGVFLAHQLDPRGLSYNVGNGLLTRGPLDEQALCQAVDAVVREQEAFRMRYFAQPSGEVMQQLCDTQCITGVLSRSQGELIARTAPPELLTEAALNRCQLVALFRGHDADWSTSLRLSASAAAGPRQMLGRVLTVARSAAEATCTELARAGQPVPPEIRQALLSLLSAPAASAGAAAAASPALLQSPAVSMPLLFVAQLAEYAAALDACLLTQTTLHGLLQAACGHSQGVAAALVVALARNDEELLTLTASMTAFLLRTGLHWEAVTSKAQYGMLAVGGLSVEALQAKLDLLFGGLPDALHSPTIALISTPTACTVAGLRPQLQRLEVSLRAEPDVVVRSLPVAVPFHTAHMQPAFERAVADAQRPQFEPFRRTALARPGQPALLGLTSWREASADGNLLEDVAATVLRHRGDWVAVCESLLTAVDTAGRLHVLDCGPGPASGDGILSSLRHNLQAACPALPVTRLGDLRRVPRPTCPLDLQDNAVLAQEYLRSRFSEPFLLSRPPLLRSTLLRLSDTEAFLAVVVHHIAFDGHSHFLLYNDIWRRYLALRARESAAPVTESRLLSLTDYAKYEQQWAHSDDPDRMALVRYWQDTLRDAPPVSLLPGDRPRPARHTFRGQKATRVLPASLVHAAKAFCRAHNTTLFTLLLSVLGPLVHRFSGATDLVLGTQVAGRRSLPGLHRLMGCFVNSLPLRLRFSADDSSETILRVAQTCVRGALEHQDLPFEEIARGIAHDPSTASPLFNINLALHNSEMAADRCDPPSELTVQRLVPEDDSCKWDLYFDFVPENATVGGRAEELVLRLEYYRDVYSAEFVARLLDAFESMLQFVVQDGDAAARHVPISQWPTTPRRLTASTTLLRNSRALQAVRPSHALVVGAATAAAADTQPTVLSSGHAVPSDEPEPLAERLLRAAERYADECALRAGARSLLTHGELQTRAQQLAAYLHQYPTARRIGVLVGPTAAERQCAVVAVRAAVAAGRAWMPLDTEWTPSRVEAAAAGASLDMLLFSAAQLRLANRLRWEQAQVRHCVCLDALDMMALREAGDERNVSLWNEVSARGAALEQEVARRRPGDPLLSPALIAAGGWEDSFDGRPFSVAEMHEYCDNIRRKCQPFIGPDSAVLEIGCASGLTTMYLAPLCGAYLATDMSPAMTQVTARVCAQLELSHVRTATVAAIDAARELRGSRFDLIVVNSVVQYLGGHNDLEHVLRGLCTLLKPGGVLFVGDVLDPASRELLTARADAHRRAHPEARTKASWDNELFVPRAFFERFAASAATTAAAGVPVRVVSCSLKHHTLTNELTLRYDVVLRADPEADWADCSDDVPAAAGARASYAHGLAHGWRDVERAPPAEVGDACAAPNAEACVLLDGIDWQTEQPAQRTRLRSLTHSQLERLVTQLRQAHDLDIRRLVQWQGADTLDDAGLLNTVLPALASGCTLCLEPDNSDGGATAARTEDTGQQRDESALRGSGCDLARVSVAQALKRFMPGHGGTSSTDGTAGNRPGTIVLCTSDSETAPAALLEHLLRPSDRRAQLLPLPRVVLEHTFRALPYERLFRVVTPDDVLAGLSPSHSETVCVGVPAAGAAVLVVAAGRDNELVPRGVVGELAWLSPAAAPRHADPVLVRTGVPARVLPATAGEPDTGRVQILPGDLALGNTNAAAASSAELISALSRVVDVQEAAVANVGHQSGVLLVRKPTVAVRAPAHWPRLPELQPAAAGDDAAPLYTCEVTLPSLQGSDLPVQDAVAVALAAVVARFTDCDSVSLTLVHRQRLASVQVPVGGDRTVADCARAVRDQWRARALPLDDYAACRPLLLDESGSDALLLFDDNADDDGAQSGGDGDGGGSGDDGHFDPALIRSLAADVPLVARVSYGTARFSMRRDHIAPPLGHSVAEAWRCLLVAMAGPGAATASPVLALPAVPLAAIAAQPTAAVPAMPPAAAEQTIHGAVLAQCARTPSAEALVCGSDTLTYADLQQRSELVARRLLHCGVRAGGRVAVLLSRSVHLVVAQLAVLRAGCSYVPLDTAFPLERIMHYLTESGARFVLTEPQAWLQALELSGYTPVDVHEAQRLAVPPVPLPLPPAHPDGECFTLFTSGSTGKPKGVPINHAAAQNVLRFVAEDVQLRQRHHTWLAVTTTTFDISNVEIWGALQNGLRLVVATTEQAASPASLAQLLTQYDVDVMQTTPSRWKLVLDAGWAGRRGFLAMCGGEHFSEELAARLFERVDRVWNGYGPTETTMYSTRAHLQRGGPVLIGEALPRTSLYIVNEKRALQPVGAAGELWIGGLGVAAGGYLNPSLDPSGGFMPNPFGPGTVYRTGDIVRQLPGSGALQYIGRRDFQVKILGVRIELGEIERACLLHAGVQAAVAVLAASQQKIVVFVEAGSHTVRPRALLQMLQGRLPPYMMPAAVIALPQLPLTLNKKTDRAQLRALAEQHCQEAVASTVLPRAALHRMLAPAQMPAALYVLEASGRPSAEADGARNAVAVLRAMMSSRADGDGDRSSTNRELSHDPVTRVVQQVWSEHLPGHPLPGPQDNFFHLGGQSLSAVSVAQALQKRGFAGATFAMMYQAPTLAALVSALVDAHAGSAPTAAAATAAAAAEAVPAAAVPTGGAAVRTAALPAMQAFAATQPLEPDQWVFPALLQFHQPCRTERLARCLQSLVQRHEALRLRTELGGEGGVMVTPLVGAEVPAVRIDSIVVRSAGSTSSERLLDQPAVQAALETLKREHLSLASGRLMAAVHVRLGDAASEFVVLLVHHMCVDMFSWSVLLDELERAYADDSDATLQQLQLPSDAQYTALCREVTGHDWASSELTHWRSVCASDSGPPRSVTPTYEHARFAEDAATVPAETFAGTVVEQVLRALGAAVATVPELAVEPPGALWLTEMQGRDFARSAAHRAVGYAAARFPVRVQPDTPVSLPDSAPAGGVGYGVLRFGSDARVADSVRCTPRFMFVHLGELRVRRGAVFSVLPWPREMMREMRQGRFHRAGGERRLAELECFSWTEGDQLHLACLYDSRALTAGTAQAILQTALRSLAAGTTLSAADRADERKLRSALVRAFGTTLGVPVNEQTDFIAAGGSSLQAQLLASRLHQQLGLPVSAQAVLLQRTPQALAAFLARTATTETAIEPVPVTADSDAAAAADGESQPVHADPRACTAAEQRMMVLEAMDPDSSAYVETLVFTPAAGTKPEAARQAAHRLMQRHDALRSVFRAAPGTSGAYERHVLSAEAAVLPWEEGEAESVSTYLSGRRETADIRIVSGAPLYRFTWLRLSATGTAQLVLRIHHMIADAASFGLLERELAAMLAGSDAAGTLQAPVPLEPVLRAEAQYLKSPQVALDRAFWEAQLTPLPPNPPPLLPARPRAGAAAAADRAGTDTGSGQNDAAARETSVLSKRTYAEMQARCRELGLTPCHLLFAAYVALMHVYTGDLDLAIAVPVSLRSAATESIVALQINTVPVRCRLPPAADHPTLHGFLSAVQSTFLECLAHSRYPFERLVQDLRARGGVLPSLLWTMFNFVEHDENTPLRGRHWPATHAKLDLGLDALHDRRTGQLTLVFEYRRDVFDARTVQAMLRSFCTLLRQLCRAPLSAPLYEVVVGTTLDEERLLRSVGGTVTDPLPCGPIHALFERNVRRSPDSVALVHGEVQWTRRELNTAADRVACALRAHPAYRADRPIIVFARKEPWAVAAMLGVWKAGGQFVPMASGMGQRLYRIVAHADATLVLTNTDLPAAPASAPSPAVLDLRALTAAPGTPADDTWAADAADSGDSADSTDSEADATAAVAFDSDRPAYRIYTSGSTGEPKGCVVTHGNLQTMVRAWLTDYDLASFPVRSVQWAPLSFDVFQGDLMRALFCVPGTLVLCDDADRVDVPRVRALVARHRATLMEVTPQFGSLLVDDDVYQLASLRVFVCGSDVMRCAHFDSILSRLRPLGTRVLNSYGMSETTIDSTFYEVPSVDPRARTLVTASGSVPIGKPMTGVLARVLSFHSAHPVPVGAVGELCLGGPAVNARNGVAVVPAGSAYTFMRTGDRARVLPSGNIEFLGRSDRTAKVRGFRVSMGEIEYHVLHSFSASVAAAVADVRSPARGPQRIVVFVVPKSGARAPALGEVQQALREALPPYMVPDLVHELSSMPLSAHGKVDMARLPSNELLFAGARPVDAPATADEARLVQMLTDIMGGPPDLDAGFLDQCASMGVIQLHNALLKSGTRIGLSALFDFPNVRALGAELARRRRDGAESTAAAAAAPGAAAAAASSLPPLPRADSSEMAIIGVALRLPGDVSTLADLHDALESRRDLFGDMNPERLEDVLKCCAPSMAQRLRADGTFQGSFLRSVSEFCPELFKISQAEAEAMCVEQRLVLEVALEALLNAGQTPASLRKSRTGVFAAATRPGYEAVAPVHSDLTVAGLEGNFIPTRVAYALDLHGPVQMVDGACASSLLALQAAAEAIQRGDCNLAVVAGVHVVLYPSRTGVFGNVGIMSPDFRCRAFDTQSKGTGIGEGVVCVVLKSLAEARRDGDHIYGTVAGIAVQSAGQGSSLTAPVPSVHAEAIRMAQQRAGVTPDDVQVVEAHGTGTMKGDLLEMEALDAVFGQRQAPPLPIGSVKSAFGHLDSAAGLLSLLKVLAGMQYGRKLPTLNCTSPMKAQSGRVRVLVDSEPWQPRDGVRVAGISSLGLNGTTAHMIVKQYVSEGGADGPQTARASAAAPPTKTAPVVLVLSALSRPHLQRQVDAWLAVATDARPHRWSLTDAACAALCSVHLLDDRKERYRLVIAARSEDSCRLALAQCARALSRDSDNDAALLTLARSSDTVLVRVGSGGDLCGAVSDQDTVHGVLLALSEGRRAAAAASLWPDWQQRRARCASCVAPQLYEHRRIWPRPQDAPAGQYFGDSTEAAAAAAAAAGAAPSDGLPEMLENMLLDTRELVRSQELAPTPEYQALIQATENALIVRFLRRANFPADFEGTEEQAFQLIGARPKYRKLFHVMLRNLMWAGLLERVDARPDPQENFRAAGIIGSDNLQGTLRLTPQFAQFQDNAEALVEEGARRFPAYADQFRFPLYVSGKMYDVVCGNMNELSVIYPGGDLFFREATFDKLGDCLGEVYYNMYCQLICKHILAQARRRRPDQPLRILECGAGMGLVTRQLLPRLRAAGERIEYWFTDLGRAFVENARRVFGQEYPFMRFRVFDITKNGAEQGLAGSFDVMISYNVIHTTDSILASVNNLASMLQPDGRLFIIESTKNDTWATLSWGVLDGWWYFRDYELRASDPMLGHERWDSVLRNAGFGEILKVPRDPVEQSHVEKFLFVCSRWRGAAGAGGGSGAAAAAAAAEPSPAQALVGWWEGWNVRGALADAEAITVSSLVTQEAGSTLSPAEKAALVRSDLEEIWSRLLGVSPVPHDVPFAELGGESLVLTQMLAMIRARLGVTLEISDGYGYPTIELLAEAICGRLAGASARPDSTVTVTAPQAPAAAAAAAAAAPPAAAVASRPPRVSVQQAPSSLDWHGCVFPGQGGRASASSARLPLDDMPEAQQTIAEASRLLGYDVRAYLWRPFEELEPVRAQQVLFVHSVAAWRGHTARMGRRSSDILSGLSLGEYAAVVCAGALPFARGLSLVTTRARLMAEAMAALPEPAGMMAVQGVDRRQVDEALEAGVYVANRMNERHFILSGLSGALERVRLRLQASGAQITVLPLKSAFHTPLMRAAADNFRAVLEQERTHVRSPTGDLLLNTPTGVVCVRSGAPDGGQAIIDALAAGSICVQLHTYETLQQMASRARDARASGAAAICEYGTGRVLTSLLQSLDPDCDAVSMMLGEK